MREEPSPDGGGSRLRQGVLSDIGVEALGIQNLTLEGALEIIYPSSSQTPVLGNTQQRWMTYTCLTKRICPDVSQVVTQTRLAVNHV